MTKISHSKIIAIIVVDKNVILRSTENMQFEKKSFAKLSTIYITPKKIKEAT